MHWWPLSLLECVYGPSWLCEVEWDKGKAGQLINYVTYSYFLSLSCLLNYILFSCRSFLFLQQKLQYAKYNANGNAKNNAELRETKKAENDTLVAQGIGIDVALMPDVVETIALKVVKKVETIVDEDGKEYVFTSAKRRIDEESFASLTGRGNGTRLISDKNGGNVTAKILKDIYKWECKKSLYATTSAYNMNEVEKQVHKLLFENKMSIWLRNGAGGVHLDKEGKILKFSLSIIHGSRDGLSFASTHPRKLLDWRYISDLWQQYPLFSSSCSARGSSVWWEYSSSFLK